MSVHKTKQGTWEVKYRDSTGRQRSKTFKKKGLADQFDRDMKNAKVKGLSINPDKAAVAVARFFEDVFLITKQVSGSTRDGYRRVWGCVDPADDEVWHLRRKWGNERLSAANDREAVLKWHAEMKREGASEAKIAVAHRLLNTIISHAVELRYLPLSDIAGTHPFYEPKENGEPWLPQDIEAIRADLLSRGLNPPRGHGGQRRDLHLWLRRRDAVAVSLMGYGALRIGEGFALQWPMLLDGNDITTVIEVTSRVPGNEDDPEDRTKTTRTKRTPRSRRKPRYLDLEDALRDDLRAWWLLNGKPRVGYVLAREPGGARLARSALTTWTRDVWAKSVKAVGLPPCSPKHLRVSCVSMWIREGRDPGTVADAAGHSEEVMWSTYRHAFRTRLTAREPFDMAAAIRQARTTPRSGVRDLFDAASAAGSES